MKVDDYVAQQCRILEEAYRQVCHTVGLKQDRQKELYDRRRHGESFQDGDFVMLILQLSLGADLKNCIVHGMDHTRF